MTDSMIPNALVPGTKAKASDLNENFAALANAILESKNFANSGISNLNDSINEVIDKVDNQKADKSELINEFTVTEIDTDLNNYKTKGTYIFSENYTPLNIPSGTSGILIVTGDKASVIKQLWFSSNSYNEIFTRNFADSENSETSEWTEWHSSTGTGDCGNPGYLRLPNGLLIQWAAGATHTITYPIAFEVYAAPLFTKYGYNAGAGRSDTGIVGESLTGFNIGSSGSFGHMQWIAIGV